jgi:Icc-related predicted phosphoesterase
MKVVLISDTHTRHKHLTTKAYKPGLPDGDLLIHAGDFTNVGQKGEVMSFIDWASQQATRYTHGVVFIAGNHDRSFDPKYFREYEDSDLWEDFSHLKKPTWLRNILSNLEPGRSNVTYLENQEIVLGGLKIWGSPITPWFYGERWAFNKQRGADIKEVWNQIPADTDILVTHGPVIGRHDYVPSEGKYAGCEELKNKIEEIKPKLHVCGHIHEGHGEEMVNGVTYVNASICDRFYDPVNRPIIVNL